MYRSSDEYERLCKTVIQIFIDYGFNNFPIDEKYVCRRMGVALVPYSTFNREDRKLLEKESNHGFFMKSTLKTPPTIYYNDRRDSEGEIRFTIFHELKHFVYDDEDDQKDDLADFFARYFMCPIPLLLLKKIDSIEEIVSFCGASWSAAENVYSNIINRRSKYDYKIFDYEIPLIEQIEPVLIEVYGLEKK